MRPGVKATSHDVMREVVPHLSDEVQCSCKFRVDCAQPIGHRDARAKRGERGIAVEEFVAPVRAGLQKSRDQFLQRFVESGGQNENGGSLASSGELLEYRLPFLIEVVFRHCQHHSGYNPPMTQLDPLTHKPDGAPRHPSTVAVLRHFRFEHLPEPLQAISAPVARLAMQLADQLPEGPDLTCGLRDLLSAKDNFVRARIP